MSEELRTTISVTVSARSKGALQGEILRITREARKLTQQQLATLAHVSRSTIAAWERDGIGSEIYDLEEILEVEHGTFKV